ncbi:proline-specific peptidase [Karstenula rhodostoma CBS 690.94]|uniref:Proline-specific peptidase n=1 Tax=Karstenula rhodostoma CBS 690.94 TaxID=1392251 RepID=A0A9P4PS07_9PLEO|nr:proline-specific peptidase [Karstenula rhodostoma CBS 690.94]
MSSLAILLVVPFEVPAASKPCHTCYKLVGDLQVFTPLILLHGGPGSGHDYFAPLLDLAFNHNIPLILLGIRSGFHLLEQSWGGMMAGVYAARQPEGLKKVILSSTPASMPLFAASTKKLLEQLPQDVQNVLEECEREGDHESEKWENSSMEFYTRFICRLDPWPQELLQGFQNLKDDSTVYNTMQGTSEFECTGSLKEWQGVSEAHKIQAEILLLNGRYNEMTDDVVKPWFEKIEKVKWITLEKSAHMGHWEERDRYVQVVADFLS